MTHDEAKRLADMIRSPHTRRGITEGEWRAIADILRKHKRPAQPPLLYDRDPEANRVQLAQHSAAYVVLDWQRLTREVRKCKRVPGTETNAMLENAINIVAQWFRIDPRRISSDAIRRIVKNRRPSLRYPRRALLPDDEP